jgi:bacterial/archaeal transporter family-2 protein
MFEIAIIILIVIIAGMAVGAQASIAGEMSPLVGGAATSFIVHLGGTILSGVLLVVRGDEQLHNWRQLNWYMWAAGAVGVVLYLVFAYAIPRLGAATTLALLLIGQLFAAMLIDHFGLFGLPLRHIDGSRAMAAILLISGGYLMMR